MKPLEEVWRDAALLVVSKPCGVPTQSTRNGEADVYSALVARFPYVGLHHRLDQPASGLLLFTLDPAVNPQVAAAFRDHTIRRTYRAVLAGEAQSGTWDRPIEGQKARTDVVVVGRGQGMTAVELSLHTGRTHQIRQHAALAGRPIVGDRRYGGEAGRRWPRLALHAWRLELSHPITGEALSFTSPIPDDLTALWIAAGGPG